MKKYILSLLTIALLGACQKDTETTEHNSFNNDVSSFEEMQISESFDWNLRKDFRLNIEGLKNLPYEIQDVLEVKNANGDAIFKTLVKMSESERYTLNAPASMEYFTINFGSISKQVVPVNGVIDFNFIPNVDNSDLDSDNL